MPEVEQFDIEFMQSFREGDQLAFRHVFNFYYPRLFYFTKKLISNKEEAEDITVTTFKKLFDRCANFDSETNMKAFLYITARNNCFNYLKYAKVIKERQRSFADQMKDDTLLQHEHEIADELVEMVRAAVNNLPDECRKIFKMLYYEELTPAEIAQILQISVSTVYNQKSRALQALRLVLGEQSMAIGWVLIILRLMETSVMPHQLPH